MVPVPLGKSQPVARPAVAKGGAPFALIGWILIALAIPASCLLLLSIPFYLGSLVMGILAITLQRRVGHGTALIVCSLVMPVLVGLLTFAFFMAPGTWKERATEWIATRVDDKADVEEESAPDAMPAVPAPVAPPAVETPKEATPLTDFLAGMDDYARRYRDAETSVQRDEIQKEAINRACVLLAEVPSMTLRAPIRDVRNPKENTTVVSFDDYDSGPYETAAPHALSVSFYGSMELEMKRSKALAITPGSTFELTGAPCFETSNEALYGTISNVQPIVRLTLGTFAPPCGVLVFRNPKWRVLVKKRKDADTASGEESLPAAPRPDNVPPAPATRRSLGH